MTLRVALVGHPLRRRHSEVMHNAAFRHFGVDAHYELRELSADGLAGFCEEVRSGNWLGFQVTAPHKETVMGFLDEVEADARQIGAVNSCEKRDDGKIGGFNTDAPGFRRSAERELGISLGGITAVVAGAGGAAPAVGHALVTAPAAQVFVTNRTIRRAVELAEAFGDTVVSVERGGPLAAALAGADLAINTTTVGMHVPGTPFDLSPMGAGAAVYDVVYSPAATELLAQAGGRGLRTANGLGMLVAQAEIAFERWTGIPDTGDVMRQALLDQGLVV